MDQSLYESIFKRKSFHEFGQLKQKITPEELNGITAFFANEEPLYKDIKVSLDIVPSSEIASSRSSQYAILFYSENKENYLSNVGYLAEQLDLYLVKNKIGSLWYGMQGPDKKIRDGLSFVIMILIGKKEEGDFRKDMSLAKRKPIEEIWEGDDDFDIADTVRFAPSACNTQNWLVKSEGKTLNVYRVKAAKRGIMPVNKAAYFNRIDLGIFLCFLELSLSKKKVSFSRTLFVDEGLEGPVLLAKYRLD